MKTILVLAQRPELPEAIRGALKPDEYRLIHRLDVSEAEPFLRPRLVDLFVIDADSAQIQTIWAVEKIRQRLPTCPILVFAGPTPWEWEEEAYLKGVSFVLNKPVRARLLAAVLERIWPSGTSAANKPAVSRLPASPMARTTEVSSRELQALEVLRDFSAILTHSLQAEALLKQFLLVLREILGINRAMVFLRRPSPALGSSGDPASVLRPVCVIGLAAELGAHVELSTETGIGSYLYRQGRVLRRTSDVAAADDVIQAEFEMIGAEVVIPILDRETFLGVAAFDGRVTGEALANSEVELIFHLLEEVGLAVRNIWLHDQLASSHELLADILRQLSSACLVVSSDLKILHANKAARRLLGRSARRGDDIEFGDLPEPLGTRIYQVLKSGTAITPFKYQAPDAPGSVFEVSLLPFQKPGSQSPTCALLLAQDYTQSEQIQRLELETANLRLIRTMAARLAHEIGNALAPISTYQQILPQNWADPEFRSGLSTSLDEGVRRILRLTTQMRFLARDSVEEKRSFPVEPLIQEAFEEAKRHQPVRNSRLTYENGVSPALVSGDRAALKHALTEILLNALQANPGDAKIGVRTQKDELTNGVPRIRIEVQDNGPGFPANLIEKPLEPFVPTTRTVGLGLGLAVSRKIVETHQGKLALANSPETHSGVVRISLPAPAAVSKQ